AQRIMVVGGGIHQMRVPSFARFHPASAGAERPIAIACPGSLSIVRTLDISVNSLINCTTGAGAFRNTGTRPARWGLVRSLRKAGSVRPLPGASGRRCFARWHRGEWTEPRPVKRARLVVVFRISLRGADRD